MLAEAFTVEVLLIASVPVAVPLAVGLKVTLIDAVWPGCNVAGKELPVIANSAPVSVAEFTVTALVPADVNVTVCVADESTSTVPKAMLVASMLSSAAAALS